MSGCAWLAFFWFPVVVMSTLSLSSLNSDVHGVWKKHGPVFGGGDLGTCFDACFLMGESTNKSRLFTMYFSWRPKKSIAITYSKDGIAWESPTIVVPSIETNSGWENEVNRPFVLKHGTKYHMWYTGQSRPPEFKSKIGYAWSTDGIFWNRLSEPVMVPVDPWEKEAIMCTHVIIEKSLFRMWYSAGDKYEPDAIGHATSQDGVHWKRSSVLNPIFRSKKENNWESYRVTCPQVIFDGIHYNLFYIGFRDDWHAAIGIARSIDGITLWERHPSNPIISSTVSGFDGDAVYKPFAIFDGSKWMLWYNGRNGRLEQIGLATFIGKDMGFPRTNDSVRPAAVNNSHHMNNIWLNFTSAEWKNPIVFAAVADEKFISTVVAFVDTFTSFGYTKNDIIIICATQACSKKLDHHGIVHHVAHRRECKTNLRCLISDGKISTVLWALRTGITVLFLDLDVYFKKCPLAGWEPKGDIHMYIQNNRDREENILNFGLFIVRPSNLTIFLFDQMLSKFRLDSSIWDQKLFNEGFENSFSIVRQE